MGEYGRWTRENEIYPKLSHLFINVQVIAPTCSYHLHKIACFSGIKYLQSAAKTLCKGLRL